ncbi:MAG TPA: hypothetical protein VGH27_18015 [Streptosporangiaceae bacterium]|jgi:hypothetical protein
MAASPGQELCTIHRAGRTWAVSILAAGVLLAGVASGPDPVRVTSGGGAHTVTSSLRHPGIGSLEPGISSRPAARP